MRLDLHVHSTASDGTVPPEEVVALAVAGGLDVLALADHDTVAGVEPAVRAARGQRLHVIPAVEMSSTVADTDLHILGYFVDVHAEVFARHGERNRARRDARMAEMVEQLALQGVRITRGQLDAQRSSPAVARARPHLARALVEAGYASGVRDAFARLIGNDCLAYVPTRVASPEEVIEVVLAAGGIPVWAHPPGELVTELLPRLVEAGLRGLEVFRTTRRHADPVELAKAATRMGLLVTGGSDWHGPESGRKLGDFFVRADEVSAFLAAGGM